MTISESILKLLGMGHCDESRSVSLGKVSQDTGTGLRLSQRSMKTLWTGQKGFEKNWGILVYGCPRQGDCHSQRCWEPVPPWFGTVFNGEYMTPPNALRLFSLIKKQKAKQKLVWAIYLHYFIHSHTTLQVNIFYRWGNWGPEWLRNFPRVLQKGSGRELVCLTPGPSS